VTSQFAQSRRVVLQSGLAGALGLTSWSVLAQAKPWRLAHQWATDHPVAQGAIKTAEVLAQRSNGRLKIDIFPAGQLGTGKEMDQQISDDSLDFTIDGPGILGLWQKTLSIYEAPFVARDWDHLIKIMEGEWGQAQFKALAANQNIQKVGRPWYYGSRHFTTRNTALRVPADAKGLKFRVPEVPQYMDMIRALGATPTPMALAEVYLSLQTGVTDGQENPLPTINSSKFFEVQKFISLTAHIVNPLVPLMSAKKWNALPPADRALVTEAFNTGAEVNDAALRELEGRLIGEFKAKGVTIIEPDRNAFRAAMKPVYEKNEAIWGKGVLEQLQAIR
jgi:tripartite ATP-independent transporter DctP family solute receptor